MGDKKTPTYLLAKIINPIVVKNTIDELKVDLLRLKTHIRSQKAREVMQEIYGLQLGHWAVQLFIFQAASSAEVLPLRLSFIGTLRRVIRRILPKFQRLQPQEIPFFKLVKLENLNANFYRKGFIEKTQEW